MNELELKYGCNPNQKPARIFMRDGTDLPLTVLNGRPGYINFLDALNSWQLVRELNQRLGGWLLNHIKKEDVKVAAHIRSKCQD